MGVTWESNQAVSVKHLTWRSLDFKSQGCHFFYRSQTRRTVFKKIFFLENFIMGFLPVFDHLSSQVKDTHTALTFSYALSSSIAGQLSTLRVVSIYLPQKTPSHSLLCLILAALTAISQPCSPHSPGLQLSLLLYCTFLLSRGQFCPPCSFLMVSSLGNLNPAYVSSS